MNVGVRFHQSSYREETKLVMTYQHAFSYPAALIKLIGPINPYPLGIHMVGISNDIPMIYALVINPF